MKKGIIMFSVFAAAIVLAIFAVTFVGMDFQKEIRLEVGETEEIYVLHFTLRDMLDVRLKHNGKFFDKFDDDLRRCANARDALFGINEGFADIIERLEDMEREENSSAIEFVGGKEEPFIYKEGQSGVKLSSDIYLKLAAALDSGENIKDAFDLTSPMSIYDMKRLTQKRISFSTNYAASSDARKSNIAIAAGKLNGKEVAKGEKLSFNETVGARSEENGYRKAKTMLFGKYVEDFGGGVCQVSTTLYNAWVRSGFDVGYYKAHSMAVGYVELSTDAMVSEYNDLILVNNSENTVYVSAFCDNDRIVIELYGIKEEYEYDIESEYIGSVPVEEEIIGDIEEDGEYTLVVEKEGSEGVESQSYIIKKKGDTVVEKKLLRKDKYGGERRILKRVLKVKEDVL